MEIIDAQLHEPGVDAAWGDRDPPTRRAVLREALDTLLGAVGATGAVLHPIEDIEWAHAMASRQPDRFVVVPMLARPDSPVRRWWDSRRWDSVDPDQPDLEHRLDQASDRPGFAGLRLFATAEMAAPPAPGSGHEIALAWCARHLVPVFLAGGGPAVVATLARAFPTATLVVDQMGLQPMGADPWGQLPSLLELAAYPTVHLKMTGLPAFSATAYPFEDIRLQVSRILEAFGPERCMWASDISQYQGRVGWGNRFPGARDPGRREHTYARSLAFVRDASWLGDEEKRLLLGGTARRVLRWPATGR